MLRIRHGQEIKARLVNRLEQPTALHWRGMRIANGIDGPAGSGAELLAPGETRESASRRLMRALIYQPLVQRLSGEQLGRGLYGVVIVDEAKPIFADSDLILALDDWRLDVPGQIIADFDNPADVLRQGRLGAVNGVNSRVKNPPLSFAPGARLRLRLVNCATARIMELAIQAAISR